MKTQDIETPDLEQEKILEGMKLVYKRLLAYKKQINSDVIVYRNGKIMAIKAEDLEKMDEEAESDSKY